MAVLMIFYMKSWGKGNKVRFGFYYSVYKLKIIM
jgi:hypothetical protein